MFTDPSFIFSRLYPKFRKNRIRQDRHFYFFLLFLLSKKVRNATIRLPKEISKPIIPININMISAAVISRTSLPMYSGEPVIGLGGYHPVMGTFRNLDFTTVWQEFQSDFLFYGICGKRFKINLKTISRSKRKDWKMPILRTFQSECPLFKLFSRYRIMSCFSIVLLAENASFVLVLLFIYMLLILVYPFCTHTKSLLKT